MLLLLDLDNTIFETKSIAPTNFQPAIILVKNYLETVFEKNETQNIIEEMWEIPFDVVAKKHNIPRNIQKDFYQKIKTLDYDFEIKTYPDYPILQKINSPKILVTTGFEKLQTAKIKALQLQDDFEEIHIDDPAAKNRKFKKGIFQEILNQRNLAPQQVWVLGDNPKSEIIAGKELGMNTVQRMQSNHPKSDFSDYAIKDFSELGKILLLKKSNF